MTSENGEREGERGEKGKKIENSNLIRLKSIEKPSSKCYIRESDTFSDYVCDT